MQYQIENLKKRLTEIKLNKSIPVKITGPVILSPSKKLVPKIILKKSIIIGNTRNPHNKRKEVFSVT